MVRSIVQLFIVVQCCHVLLLFPVTCCHITNCNVPVALARILLHAVWQISPSDIDHANV